MKIYRDTEKKQLKQVICNCCGKTLKLNEQMLLEGVCTVRISWGYFSGKDGETHSFDLCEACYDRITGEFAVPVEKKEELELV